MNDDAVLVFASPAEEAAAIVAGAERDLGETGVSTPWAFLSVLALPRSTFRTASPAAWQTGLVVVFGAALLRSAAFAAFGMSGGLRVARVLSAGAVGLVSPFAFVGVAAAALFALWHAMRVPREPLVAVSVAFLAAVPLALKALVQTVAMAVTRHALQPAGILGWAAPNAPAALRSVLAPLDLFGVWAIVLVMIGAFVSASRDMLPATTDGSAD